LNQYTFQYMLRPVAY